MVEMTMCIPAPEDNGEAGPPMWDAATVEDGAPIVPGANPSEPDYAAQRNQDSAVSASAADALFSDATSPPERSPSGAMERTGGMGTDPSLERSQERLLALHEATVRLAAQTDPAIALETVLHSAGMLLGASSATFYRWDAAANLLRCARNWQVPVHDTTPDQRPGEGLAGHAFLLRAPLLINDYPGWSQAMASGRIAGLRAALAVPLTRAGQVLGVVVMRAYDETVQFTPDDARLLTLFADQAAA
ncbi:MAG TPA: GAF domain-containing protein, partial [Thermomicrobiales bacterium]